MSCLCLLFLLILAALGAEPELVSTEPRCDQRLDVISYREWPILLEFSHELTENALLLNIGCQRYDFSGKMITRAVLYDQRKKTYLYQVEPYYNIENGGYETREIYEISGLSVRDIEFGVEMMAILTEDGFVWTAGMNSGGALSGGALINKARPEFTKVQGVPAVKALAVGSWHCVVLAEDGTLHSWGDGTNGRLGRHVEDSVDPFPKKISLGNETSVPKSICCAAGTCMVLTENAKVFTWGNQHYIGRTSGNVENGVPGRVEGIPRGETVVKVTCGFEHVVALTSSGRIYGWGHNEYGELQQAPACCHNATELDLNGNVARDVQAGNRITIVTTVSDDVYYFGKYDGGTNINATLPNRLYPRDLMAKTHEGQDTYGSVSLGCV